MDNTFTSFGDRDKDFDQGAQFLMAVFLCEFQEIVIILLTFKNFTYTLSIVTIHEIGKLLDS